MKKTVLLFLIFILYLNVFAQSDINKLLPDSKACNGWQKDGEAETYNAANLYDFIDGGADIYLEYGFVQAITQEYQKDNFVVTIDIFQMKSAEAAYGIYSSIRNKDDQQLAIGAEGILTDYQVTFRQDCYFVVVTGYDKEEKTQNALKLLGESVSNKIPPSSEKPSQLSLLPQKYCRANSIGIINGVLALNKVLYLAHQDVLDINNKNVQGVFAEYGNEEEQVHLLIIKYENPEIALQKKQVVSEIFKDKYIPAKNYSDFYLNKDRKIFGLYVLNENLYIFHNGTHKNLTSDLVREIKKNEHQGTYSK